MTENMSRREALKGIALTGVGLAMAAGGGWAVQAAQDTEGGKSMALKPMPYALPELPYKSLEPAIDDATLALHHDKHHAAYVAGANKALEMLEKAREGGDMALVKHWERELAFNGSGVALHNLYWQSLWPNGRGKPSAALAQAIEASFGSQEKMIAQLSAATKAVEGSGWGILVVEPVSSRLAVLQVEKHQDLTIWGCTPLLICDVWEHAYYLKYQNKRPDYVDAVLKIIDWEGASKRFSRAVTE